jgi:arginine deiminase
MIAIKQMLDQDWFGTRRVAVVVDELDCNIDRMHLDTVFAVLNKTVVIVSDDIVGMWCMG